MRPTPTPAKPGAEFVPARHLGVDIERAMQGKSGNRIVPMQVPQTRQMDKQKGSFLFRLEPPPK